MAKSEAEHDDTELQEKLCFSLYVCSRRVIRKYKDFLDALGLTYTQYITMDVMWERKTLNVKQLGDALYLDSGTLTPLLKRLESIGYVSRTRSRDDERTLVVTLTSQGKALQAKSAKLRKQMCAEQSIPADESVRLNDNLNRFITKLNN